MKSLGLSLFLVLISYGLFSQTLKGKVIRVADGDTITLLDSSNNQIRIRLYGIDCPEAKQDFGTAAKNSLQIFVFQKMLVLM